MERDSILFYRSFYEAIQGLPKDIQLEIYTAVMEYGLNGVVPDDLKPVARGMFSLMKPVIDTNNTRFENGKKGARYGKLGGRPPKNKKPGADYNLSFEQEAEQMKADSEWIALVCDDFKISPDEYADRLQRFLMHCIESRADKPHESFNDAKSHFRYWMGKAFSQQDQPTVPPPKKPVPKKPGGSRIEATKEYFDELERHKKTAVSPSDYIRSKGYDPDVVTMANLRDEEWLAQNPPTLKPLSTQ